MSVVQRRNVVKEQLRASISVAISQVHPVARFGFPTVSCHESRSLDLFTDGLSPLGQSVKLDCYDTIGAERLHWSLISIT